MSLTIRKLQLLLLALLIICSGCSNERINSVLTTTKSVSGTVVKIVDGDTITVLDVQNVQHKIRLKGIDAPERRQEFGSASREHLGNLVFGKEVRVEYEKIDWRGRLIGTVWLDGTDECLEQLKSGLAWHYKEYEKEQSAADRQLYANAEQEARSQKLGLWKDPAPKPPWDYRHHANGSKGEADSSEDETPVDQDINNVSPQLKRNFTTSTPVVDESSGSAPSADNPSSRPTDETTNLGLIRGNRNRMIYHWPGCPNYDDIAPQNRVPFQTREDAEKAGYRAAKNCR